MIGKKIKRITKYVSFHNPFEILWGMKIDENGKPQGTGFFLQMKVGTASIEKRRKYHRDWRPIMEAKRKNYGFHKISLPISILFDWHHVNKNDVVAIPRNIHNAIKHKCGDGKLEGVVG